MVFEKISPALLDLQHHLYVGTALSLILNCECHRGGSGSYFVWMVSSSVHTLSRIQYKNPRNTEVSQECFVLPML